MRPSAAPTSIPSDRELEALVAGLGSVVEESLGTWLASETRMTAAPTVRVRRWSFFVRFPIAVSTAGGPDALLVKIRRQPHLAVEEAIGDHGLRDEGREDFATLRRLEQLTANDAGFCAVRALDFLEDWSALVMEELPASPFKRELTRGAAVLSGPSRRRLELMSERAGRLLRLLHDGVSSPHDGPLLDDEVRGLLTEGLTHIEQRSPKLRKDGVRDLLTRVEQLGGHATVPHSRLHRDFNTVNVLVNPQARVGLIDPRMLAGAVYRDLAKFVVDLETFSVQSLSHGLYLRAATDGLGRALVRGYFGEAEPDTVALELFRLVSLLDKLRDDEDRLTRPVRRAVLRSLDNRAIAWRRRYLVALTERQRLRVASALDAVGG